MCHNECIFTSNDSGWREIQIKRWCTNKIGGDLKGCLIREECNSVGYAKYYPKISNLMSKVLYLGIDMDIYHIFSIEAVQVLLYLYYKQHGSITSMYHSKGFTQNIILLDTENFLLEYLVLFLEKWWKYILYDQITSSTGYFRWRGPPYVWSYFFIEN